jgi:transposase
MSDNRTQLPRPVRRRLKRIVQKSRDHEHARRAQALLVLWETSGNVSETARRCQAARSAVTHWRGLYEADGEAGLTPRPRGRSDWKASAPVLIEVDALVRSDPTRLGYLRSRWSSELLALELKRRLGVVVHATTIRRWLVRLRIAWRRARPTLHIADPRKAARMRAITHALNRASAQDEVFYVDEADIALNPRIGPAWQPIGAQQTIPTPGKNRKHYVGGALNARTGTVVWVDYTSKTTELFLRLLEALHDRYRRAQRLWLILDNYIVHSSRLAQTWLARHPKIKLLFQPAYHPWVNHIERLWKQLHDTVTRNHRYPTLEALMGAVRRFMHVCQPFPGSLPALATRS